MPKVGHLQSNHEIFRKKVTFFIVDVTEVDLVGLSGVMLETRIFGWAGDTFLLVFKVLTPELATVFFVITGLNLPLEPFKLLLLFNRFKLAICLFMSDDNFL